MDLRQDGEPFNLGDTLVPSGETALIELGEKNEERVLSFADLDAMADAVAIGLTARGLKRGDRVAILSPNRAEFFASYLGVMRAGFVAVPINIKLPPATIRQLLADCDARLVFCAEEFAALVADAVPIVVYADASNSGFNAFAKAGTFETVRPSPAETALILYTSGSSGLPKGVVLSHDSQLWVLKARRRRAGGRQRVLAAAPLYHMNGLITCQTAFSQGDEVVLMPSFTAKSYIEACGHYTCTTLASVPPMIAMALRERETLGRTDLSAVITIRMGSAPVTQALLDGAQAAFPNAAIINVYGTTEAGSVIFAPHPEGLPTPPLSVGCGHPAVDLRLADESGADGQTGVLQIRSPALFSGYHNRPDASRSAMTADGFYITGDIFRRDDRGFYYFVGRADDMFVSGGENIYPSDVERMLARCPGIQEVAVVPVDDDIKGTKPVAFVVRAEASLTEQSVKDYALAHGPAYQHPRQVWFLSDLPLSGTNKVDRRALAKLARDRLATDTTNTMEEQGR